MHRTLGDESETAAERKALLTLFWCTAGPGWIQKFGWQDGDSDLAEWWGIGVDPSDKGVTLVDLRRNGLTGAMPPEIGHLGRLRHLFLGDNDLQGSIPPAIGQLSQLCILSLRGNNLKGQIVPELGDLSALQTLSLRDNRLTGHMPPQLGQLTSLRHLFLNNNNLGGPIPDELSNLSHLEQLFLGDNHLEGPIPASFSALMRLEELVLSGNQLNGRVPVELGDLTALARLELDSNKFAGDIPHGLCALSNLKILYLNNNNLSGPIPTELGMLSWLERLDLSENNLTGSIPTELGQLFSLQLLRLNNNRLVGGIPCELGRLHHINLLLLGGNQLSEAPPIVGGKGLRRWQVAQRKAFLNGWSMMERLTFLEYENARLRKENDLLKKRCSVFLDRDSPRPSSHTSESPLPNSPHPVFLSPTPLSPVHSSPISSSRSPAPAVANGEPVHVDPSAPSLVPAAGALGPPHRIPSSPTDALSKLSAPSSLLSQDSEQSIASLPPLTPREAMVRLRAVASECTKPIIAAGYDTVAATGPGEDLRTKADKNVNVTARPSPRDPSKVGPPSTVVKGLRSRRSLPSCEQDGHHADKGSTGGQILSTVGRLSSGSQSANGGEAPELGQGSGSATEAFTRRLRLRARHGVAATHVVCDDDGGHRSVEKNGKAEGGKGSVEEGGISVRNSSVKGPRPSTAPLSLVHHQDGSESTGSASSSAASPGAGQEEADKDGGRTASYGRSWASLVGMTPPGTDNGVGAFLVGGQSGASRGRIFGENGAGGDRGVVSPEDRGSSFPMQSPLSQMVLGLFRVGSSDNSAVGAFRSANNGSPASPAKRDVKAKSLSGVGVLSEIASPE